MSSHASRAALLLLLLGCAAPATPPAAPAADPLPSWNEGPAKARIVEFVRHTTTPGDPGFVAPPDRIAVFDNDGTLWVEQPLYTELLFALDQVRAEAPHHPEWRTRQPFKAVLQGDARGALAGGQKSLAAILGTTHAGMTVATFDSTVRGWIATARHPATNRRFTSMVYQPQVELLAWLRSQGYQTWIVTGGTANFVRAFVEPTYGVPPEHVVGSRLRLMYRILDGGPAVVVEPAIDLVDDGPGKPVGIAQAIGRRPVIAVGNSDGDYEMLDYSTSGSGPRLGIIIHHDDGAREYAYDRDSHVGRLARGLDSAATKGWLVTSMKQDWKVIFPDTTSTEVTHAP